ncbi:Nucleolar Protein 10 [Manis pentadactyla]|nr:Nucleolar Protein 10 [Manis pentadactyla]
MLTLNLNDDCSYHNKRRDGETKMMMTRCWRKQPSSDKSSEKGVQGPSVGCTLPPALGPAPALCSCHLLLQASIISILRRKMEETVVCSTEQNKPLNSPELGLSLPSSESMFSPD